MIRSLFLTGYLALITHGFAAAQKKYSINFILLDTIHKADFDHLKKDMGSFAFFRDSISMERQLHQSLLKLRGNGFLTSSIDSIKYDSTICHAFLYLGERYDWAFLSIRNVDGAFLAGTGFRQKLYSNRPFRIDQLAKLENNIINNCENNGYPFATVRLDSIVITPKGIRAVMNLERNRFIRIDSVIMKGKEVVAPVYIHNYIGIKPGSVYDESKISRISNRLRELPFVTESKSNEVAFLEKETKLYLYLEPKKASQFDGIIGMLPDNDKPGKISLTGELHLKLQNSLRWGEVIEVNWKQLPAKTQDLRVHLLYPYVLSTPIGLDGNLSIYKKDTTYLDVVKNLGVQYMFTGTNYLKAFVNDKESSLLNTENFKSTTVLPDFADISVTSYGLAGHFEKLDYRFNPRTGYMLDASASTGNRVIKKIADLPGELYDSLDLKTAQYHFEFVADYFIPLSQRQVLSIGNRSAYLNSKTIFDNELFRIGGLRSLRGFDEESIYASLYTIGKLEYRYLLEQNSFLFAFFNVAWYENTSRKNTKRIMDTPYGFGAGINFETRLGIMSVSYALGKQFDNPIYFRTGKVHFGIVSYF